MSKDKGSQAAHIRYMTPKQIEQMRFVLFAKAAQSMGERIDALKQERQSTGRDQAIAAIRSEWVVDE
jgi:hypothetical protein